MADQTLSRSAGPIALGAGGVLVAAELGRFLLMKDDRITTLLDPLFRVANIGYFFGFVGLAIALVALYGRMGPRAGRFGLVAFLTALVGTIAQGGNMWFDGFAAPWLAEVAPQALGAELTAILLIGAQASYALVALGWVLFGIAAWRSRLVPAGVALAVVAGGVLAFQSGWSPYGLGLGLAVAAVGGRLIYSDRSAKVSVAS